MSYSIPVSSKSVLDSLNQSTTLLFLPGDYALESKVSITNTSNLSDIVKQASPRLNNFTLI